MSRTTKDTKRFKNSRHCVSFFSHNGADISDNGKFLGYLECTRLKKKGSHRRRAKMKVIKTRILNESKNDE